MPLPTTQEQLDQVLSAIVDGQTAHVLDSDLSAFFLGLHATRHTGPVHLVLHLKNGVPRAVDVGPVRRIRLTPCD